MARAMKRATATQADEVIKTEEATKPAKKRATVAKKKEFKDSDGILCRSVTPGKLVMVGKKTGMKYIWNNYGHEYDIEYRDLVVAVRTRSKFVFGPLFIIEDEDFINEFNIVKKFYDNSYNLADLNEILEMPVEEMKNAILALPPGAKKNFQNIASTAVQGGTLDSLTKIRVIDEIYGIELKLLVEG